MAAAQKVPRNTNIATRRRNDRGTTHMLALMRKATSEQVRKEDNARHHSASGDLNLPAPTPNSKNPQFGPSLRNSVETTEVS